MPLAIDIDITDRITATLARVRGAVIDGGELHQAIAFSAEAQVKDHLKARGYLGRVNALGGQSTGFWKRVHDSVESSHTQGQATVTVKQRGFALHVYGGTVWRKPGGPALSIPVDKSAHGISASLYPRKLLYTRPKPGASLDTVGYLFLRGKQKTKKDGTLGKSYERGDLIYVLKTRTVHKPDYPGPLPTQGDFQSRAQQAIADHLDAIEEEAQTATN